jgi:hypothetical protein
MRSYLILGKHKIIRKEEAIRYETAEKVSVN